MRKSNAIIATITLFVVLFVVNFLAARHPARIDLTDNGIYTLSPATEKILTGLKDVVTIRVYFTEELPPSLQMLRRSVEDIIAEMKTVAGKNIQVEFIDPGYSQAEEQSVMMLGIPPLTLNVVERDKQEVAKIYLGMSVLYGQEQQVIPVVKSPENLEYDLAEAVLKVSSGELPQVAWWGIEKKEAGEFGEETFNIIRYAISRRYQIADIGPDDLGSLLPEKYPVLILSSSNAVSGDDLMAIDQYLMRGGRIIAILNRYAIAPTMAATVVRSNIFDAFAHYGALVDEGLVLDESNAMASFSGGPVTYHMPYAFWPDVRSASMNQSDPVVSDLETVVFTWTSPISFGMDAAPAPSDVVLASSSDASAVATGESIEIDPQSATKTLVSSEKGRSALAAVLVGPFSSYLDGSKKSAGGEFKSESPDSSRIFIVGSSRWISDAFLQNFPANAALFENAVDSFAMGDLLIGIRSKESSSRPLEIVSDPARSAIKYFNLAFGPMAISIAGILVFLSRRSKRNMLSVRYGN